MGTRAMVLREIGRGVYECYYRHLDGYPTGLGVELIEALRQPLYGTWKDVVTALQLEDENITVAKPEDAFLKVQADLEYIYVVKNYGKNNTSLTIYKTTDFYNLPPFTWIIWYSYKEYFPSSNDVIKTMAQIEQSATITLECLQAYHKAIGR